MITNVRDFGALGDGITDDRVAIQAAIDHAVRYNSGGILFPSGTYRVSRVSTNCSIELNGVNDFMVMGEGPKSVVKLMDTIATTSEWHVFRLHKNCQRVVFKDLVIDGNKDFLTQPNEQSHGIHVEPGTEDLVIDRCILRECHGDGMRLLGASGNHAKRLRVQNSLFQRNKRSGIAIQRAIAQIIISNCIFDATEEDQCIDIETTNETQDGSSELIIQGCIINHTNPTHAVTLSSKIPAHPLVRCKFSDNIVMGGNLFCTDVNQLTIQNNIIVVPNLSTEQRNPVDIPRGGDSIVITGNLLISENTANAAVISLRELNQRKVTRALVTNNLCFACGKNGIECLSGDDVTIQGNMIVATGSCEEGIFIRSESSSMDNISVRDNDVTVKGEGRWSSGIRLAANLHKIRNVSIVGNSIRTATNGIQFGDIGGFMQSPVCALNRIADDVTSPITGIGILPFKSLVVGGAASRGGTTPGSGTGRFIAGIGDPNIIKVAGNVGDIFQRLDGIAGATLYVKETGNSTNTGWVAK